MEKEDEELPPRLKLMVAKYRGWNQLQVYMAKTKMEDIKITIIDAQGVRNKLQKAQIRMNQQAIVNMIFSV